MQSIDLINEIMSKTQTFDTAQINEFFLQMGAVSIAVLRGVNGDEFVTDFLTAAINDKNPLSLKPANTEGESNAVS